MAWYEDIHATKRHRLGTRKRDVLNNEYVYLKGVASNAAGKFVVYDENFATTLLTADEVGPVGVAMAAFDTTTTYGWAQIYGVCTVASTDTVLADKAVYIDGTAGRVDDADVAGDSVHGAFTMTADTSNVATVFLSYPWVSDIAHD
jgi:hypothetical protein